LEELLLDYEDYLRHRRLPLWAAGSPEASAVRNVQRQFRKDRSDQSDRTDRSDLVPLSVRTDLTDRQRWTLYSAWLDSPDAAVRANAIICLIHQANYLLDQQIATLEDQFITEGGYSERLAAARLTQRARNRTKPDPSDRSDSTDRSDPTDLSDLIPECPRCRKPMVLRTAKQGQRAGQDFWGCSGYPDCRQTVPV
jgi:four helix bundle suffix protein